jgi:hypothetical protein
LRGRDALLDRFLVIERATGSGALKVVGHPGDSIGASEPEVDWLAAKLTKQLIELSARAKPTRTGACLEAGA